MALLEIENLSVDFPSHTGVMHAVDGVSLSLDAGDVLGIVGESGSGKSVTMMALMGLVAYPGRVKADTLRFDGHDLLALSRIANAPLDRQRPGDDFSGPDDQPEPVLHRRLSAGRNAQAASGNGQGRSAQASIELLEQVGIPAPESRLGSIRTRCPVA
jgi:dipeptide transport system ATP-binding protein